jgi:sialate O-acetylesterase
MRQLYGYDFPFYNVQLSSHAGSIVNDWPGLYTIRCEQERAASLIDNSYLAASYDVGVLSDSEPEMAHPYNKKPVGDRLAYLALSEIYAKGSYDIDDWACPVPDEVKWSDDKAVITFKYVGKGLQIKNGRELLGFSLLDEDNEIICSVRAEITDDDEVTVTIPEKRAGKFAAIGYACEAVAAPLTNNLANSNDLPAVAFKVDKE